MLNEVPGKSNLVCKGAVFGKVEQGVLKGWLKQRCEFYLGNNGVQAWSRIKQRLMRGEM